jgi:hypothetical protein
MSDRSVPVAVTGLERVVRTLANTLPGSIEYIGIVMRKPGLRIR